MFQNILEGSIQRDKHVQRVTVTRPALVRLPPEIAAERDEEGAQGSAGGGSGERNGSGTQGRKRRAKQAGICGDTRDFAGMARRGVVVAAVLAMAAAAALTAKAAAAEDGRAVHAAVLGDWGINPEVRCL